MPFPYFTAATAAFIGIFQMLLTLNVASARGRFKTGLGDGGHPGLLRRIRVHGNLAENAPLFLILLALVEGTGQWVSVVPIFAAVFVVARLSHMIGLFVSEGANPFRFVGVIATVGLIVALSVMLAITLSRDTQWASALPFR